MFQTDSIHAGQTPDPTYGSIIPPLHLTSTYVQTSPGEHQGYEYTRSGNPNFTNLETALATLEKGTYANIYPSGLGATTVIIAALMQKGDKVIALNDLYGGTYRLFENVFKQFGIDFELVDFDDENAFQKALATQPKMLFLESPTNPLLKTSDIEHITNEARKNGIISVVDNTFASPYFQNPITLGADIVMHSSTKYIGGHSDAIGGVTITNDKEIKAKFDYYRNAMGINPSPFDAWLMQRSLKTLAIRMKEHKKNAVAVTQFLKKHPLVDKVYYPGFSGIVSVEFKLDYDQMIDLISNFKIFALAESLGGVESLVDHPSSMTHASIPKIEREAAGLKDGLVRLSVGIEDEEDIIEDLKIGLSRF